MTKKDDHDYYGDKGYCVALNGMNFVVGPYGVVSRTMLKEKEYEEKTQRLLKDACQADLLSIDVGAHIGTNTYVMCKHSRFVLAFEPASDFFPVLTQNIALNQNSMSNLKAFQLALGSKKGKTSFDHDAFKAKGIDDKIYIGNLQGNLKQENTETVGSVDVVKGDDFLEEEGYSHNVIGLIKIDVEGFEGPVLEGFRKTIETSKPSIYLELHDNNNPGGVNTVKQALKLMEDFGYERTCDTKNINENSLWEHKSKL